MDNSVSLMNNIQDALNLANISSIEFPQIVVVGSQSSGKTSVLENIVGFDFLPRGLGMVTKCPLILQLINTKNQANLLQEQSLFSEIDLKQISSLDGPSCVFLHKPSEIFTNFNDVRSEIMNETERLLDNDLVVTSVPINLKIFSPNLVNLTLVDLPGLTKISLGNQPVDIESQITNLITPFVSNPNSLILAIVPANIDIATSESLKISKQYDPKGLRTIIVVTKLDLMDKGTSANDLLTGKVIQNYVSIIGVVNRSELDSQQGMTITQSLVQEKNFFRKNYRTIENVNGTEYLSLHLNKLLVLHIRKCLPQLKEQLQQQIDDNNSKIQMISFNDSNKSSFLLKLISKFSSLFSDAINGFSTSASTSEINDGARIYYIFYGEFVPTIEAVNALAGLSKDDIHTAIRNAMGYKPSLFIPQPSFECLVRRQMDRLTPICFSCIDNVLHELTNMITACTKKIEELSILPTLHEKIVNLMSEKLTKKCEKTKRTIKLLIEIEKSLINTKHPYFNRDIVLESNKSTLSNQSSSNQSRNNPSTVSNNSNEIESIVHLIEKYYEIVKIKIEDSVIKSTNYFLINYCLENINQFLIKKIYKNELLDELLTPSKQAMNTLKDAHKRGEALNRALKIVNDFIFLSNQ